ncbi:MAG: hypothetical protein DMD89_38975 [Candidatus Rokuibacteriota bacterium]|nr:MAG: hypothetical protein DMD89_38975 [Candidatus Rokubacteria bacterium]
MRVLLDEQLPRPLVYELAGHDDVRTVQQQFLAADRNLEFQQNLARSSLRGIVLPLRPVPNVRPGQVQRID